MKFAKPDGPVKVRFLGQPPKVDYPVLPKTVSVHFPGAVAGCPLCQQRGKP